MFRLFRIFYLCNQCNRSTERSRRSLWFQVPFHWLIELFNRHTLGKISWFINIAASHNRYMIGQ